MICKKCLNSLDHPFSLFFDKDGICSGCTTNIETESFSEKAFDELCNEIKRQCSSSQYDCVVPVRGDADDYFVVNKMLQYKLRPLLVGVNSYFLNDIGWHNLQNLQTHFDLDMEFYHPNLRHYREMVVYSLARFDDINLPYQFTFHSFVKRVAQQKGIKFIVYGENQPTEQTGNFSNFDYPEKSLWFHTVFDFRAHNITSFLGTGANLRASELSMYQYPKQNGQYPKGIFLSNYVRWDSFKNNVNSKSFGFRPQEQIRTYDVFHRAGFSHYYEMHDFLRFKKHNYLKVRDHLNRDIRMGHLSRNQALSLYDDYLNVPYDFSSFFSWLGVSETGRDWLMKHRFSLSKNAKSNQLVEKPLFAIENIETYSPKEHYIKFYKGVNLRDRTEIC